MEEDHWNEVNGGGALTGIVDASGHDMRNELMTGWLDMPTFYSNTTSQQFRDIGFVVVGGEIFSNGFETGNTSAWSLAVP